MVQRSGRCEDFLEEVASATKILLLFLQARPEPGSALEKEAGTAWSRAGGRQIGDTPLKPHPASGQLVWPT